MHGKLDSQMYRSSTVSGAHKILTHACSAGPCSDVHDQNRSGQPQTQQTGRAHVEKLSPARAAAVENARTAAAPSPAACCAKPSVLCAAASRGDTATALCAQERAVEAVAGVGGWEVEGPRDRPEVF